MRLLTLSLLALSMTLVSCGHGYGKKSCSMKGKKGKESKEKCDKKKKCDRKGKMKKK